MQRLDKKRQGNLKWIYIYKVKVDEAMKLIRIYYQNLLKAYALIWECYAKAMQSKAFVRANYVSSIYNNPIKLLKAVNEHALIYQESHDKMSIFANAMTALHNTKQREERPRACTTTQ
jgi:hypothetical protein